MHGVRTNDQGVTQQPVLRGWINVFFLHVLFFVYFCTRFLCKMEILIGILCGLVLALFFSFGPTFFGLIQNSIQYGFRKGVAFEIGVNASDILIVLLMLTLLKSVDMATIMHNPYVAFIGGGVIIVLGFIIMLRKPTRREGNKLVFEGVPRGREVAVHGFALNALNPTVWLYWITLITFLSAEVGLTAGERYLFFISLLLTELGVGILKCRLASLLQNIISGKMLAVVNKVLGSVLVGIGIYLIVSMLVRMHHPDIPRKDAAESATQLIQRIHSVARDSSASREDTLYLQ